MSFCRSSRKHWLFLAAAVLFEVTGTTVMTLARSGAWLMTPRAGMALMFGLVGLSYYCLSLAIRGLPVGVAYAFWEGVGLVLITLVSVLALGEAMTPTHLLALAAVLCGAALIRRGTSSPHARHGGNRNAASDRPSGDADSEDI